MINSLEPLPVFTSQVNLAIPPVPECDLPGVLPDLPVKLETLPMQGQRLPNTAVHWNNKLQKWSANVQKEGKHHHLGLFEQEEEARDAYRRAEVDIEAYFQARADEKRRNDYAAGRKSSIYHGVCFEIAKWKWRAFIKDESYKKQRFLGYFDNEEDAAKAVRQAQANPAKYLKRRQKLLAERRYSGHTGVSYDKRRNKWRSSIKYNGKWWYLGGFKSERGAAAEYEKAAKSPRAYLEKKGKLGPERTKVNPKSQIKGVTWSKKYEKWAATVSLRDAYGNIKRNHLGYFDTEAEALQAINSEKLHEMQEDTGCIERPAKQLKVEQLDVVKLEDLDDQLPPPCGTEYVNLGILPPWQVGLPELPKLPPMPIPMFAAN